LKQKVARSAQLVNTQQQALRRARHVLMEPGQKLMQKAARLAPVRQYQRVIKQTVIRQVALLVIILIATQRLASLVQQENLAQAELTNLYLATQELTQLQAQQNVRSAQQEVTPKQKPQAAYNAQLEPMLLLDLEVVRSVLPEHIRQMVQRSAVSASQELTLELRRQVVIRVFHQQLKAWQLVVLRLAEQRRVPPGMN
jgi:hypothetical protein